MIKNEIENIINYLNEIDKNIKIEILNYYLYNIKNNDNENINYYFNELLRNLNIFELLEMIKKYDL